MAFPQIPEPLQCKTVFNRYLSNGRWNPNKLANLEATLVRNSAHLLTHLLTGVKCRATSVAKNVSFYKGVCHMYV